MSDDTSSPEDLETKRAYEPGAESARRIGNYHILQSVGEGGMGEVFEAEQETPVRRRVALKVIKHGMNTKQVVARFEAERQALAMMDHPSVAKVFEAGATSRGRPYFVMEFVRGVPVTEHCDRQKLTVRERLELFLQICDGVQHAHQKAIIHRDLKPSNVLISIQDGRAVPKIIDFGVAKATTQKLTEKTMFTELGVLIGTPEYMSPEQAEGTGQSVDTRTDVYSLGVMLYELLVGALPFDSKRLRSGGYEGIRKKIREDEPPRPSTRLSTLGDDSMQSAKRRRVDLPGLQRQLRGDLDWITMRALEKDRTRRYGSPSELAADIRRHLKHEPVAAGPPSAAYRARKFIQRHRVGVGVAVLMLGVLVTFAVTTTVQSRRIAREAETSERVSEFLADMFGNVDPQVLGSALWKDLLERAAEGRRRRDAPEEEIGAAVASLEDALAGVNPTSAALRLVDEQILARAGETIERELSAQPELAGRLEHTIGETYRKLGLYEKAEHHAQRAVEIREAAFGPTHPGTLASKSALGRTYFRRGRYAEAERLLSETVDLQQRVLRGDHPNTLRSMNYLYSVYHDQGRYEEGERLTREALKRQRRELGEEHPDTLFSMNYLADFYRHSGKLEESEALFGDALRIGRRALGDDDPQTSSTMYKLAGLYEMQGRLEEAERLFVEALAARTRVLGDEHHNTLKSKANLADLYRKQGRYADAEVLLLETLPTRKRLFGDEHQDTLLDMLKLVQLYSDHGGFDDAQPFLREVLAIRARVLGDDPPDTLSSMDSLVDLYEATAIAETASSAKTRAGD